MSLYSLFNNHNKRPRFTLRIVSAVLILTFLAQDFAQAAPEISGFAARQNLRLDIPQSIALVDETRMFPDAAKSLVLIQDAHTNESAELNIAKILDRVLSDGKTRHVFLEAGSGNDSLSYLRRFGTADKRREVAASFLRRGLIQGPDYLDLTSDKKFSLWGVENKKLYWEGLRIYRDLKKDRTFLSESMDRLGRAKKSLASRILNEPLLKLEKDRDRFLAGDLPAAAYFERLMDEAASLHLPLEAFGHLLHVRDLRIKEKEIDFEKASAEEARLVASLPADDQKKLSGIAAAMRGAGTQENAEIRDAFYSLLKEKITNPVFYSELSKYIEYVLEARTFNAADVLEEKNNLESIVFARMAGRPEEKEFIRASRDAETLRKLFNLELSKDDYAGLLENPKDSSFLNLAGYFNLKLMNLGAHAEDTVFWDDRLGADFDKAMRFYELTYERDRAFLVNALKKMNETGEKNAVLVTGGFHTEHLKELLRQNRISYTALVPRILKETDKERYEKLLLSPLEKTSGVRAVSRSAGTWAVLPPAEVWAVRTGLSGSIGRKSFSSRHEDIEEKPYFGSKGARLPFILRMIYEISAQFLRLFRWDYYKPGASLDFTNREYQKVFSIDLNKSASYFDMIRLGLRTALWTRLAFFSITAFYNFFEIPEAGNVTTFNDAVVGLLLIPLLGMNEEVLYRAFLQGHILKNRPFYLANMIQAAAFTATHYLYLVSPTPLSCMPFFMAAGLVFGSAYRKGGIGASFIGHSVYNFVSIAPFISHSLLPGTAVPTMYLMDSGLVIAVIWSQLVKSGPPADKTGARMAEFFPGDWLRMIRQNYLPEGLAQEVGGYFGFRQMSAGSKPQAYVDLAFNPASLASLVPGDDSSILLSRIAEHTGNFHTHPSGDIPSTADLHAYLVLGLREIHQNVIFTPNSTLDIYNSEILSGNPKYPLVKKYLSLLADLKKNPLYQTLDEIHEQAPGKFQGPEAAVFQALISIYFGARSYRDEWRQLAANFGFTVTDYLQAGAVPSGPRVSPEADWPEPDRRITAKIQSGEFFVDAAYDSYFSGFDAIEASDREMTAVYLIDQIRKGLVSRHAHDLASYAVRAGFEKYRSRYEGDITDLFPIFQKAVEEGRLDRSLGARMAYDSGTGFVSKLSAVEWLAGQIAHAVGQELSDRHRELAQWILRNGWQMLIVPGMTRIRSRTRFLRPEAFPIPTLIRTGIGFTRCKLKDWPRISPSIRSKTKFSGQGPLLKKLPELIH